MPSAIRSFVAPGRHLGLNLTPGALFSPVQSLHPPATLYSTGMRRWSLVCLLCLGIVIAYIDRTNLSVSLASADFKALFHLTDKDRGLLGSAFFWSYAILQIPAGAVADRFGVKSLASIGLPAGALPCAATAGVTLFLLQFARLCG